MAEELSARLSDDAANRRALIALAIVLVGGALVFVIVEPLSRRLGLGSDVAVNALGNLLWLTLALATAALLSHRLVPGFSAQGAVAFPLGMAGYAIALGIVAISGHAHLIYAPPIALGAFGLATIGFLFGALAEETLFRGLLQPLLAEAWGPAIAVVVTAAAFVAEHVVGGWRDPITLLNIGLAGAWFGMLALRSGGFGVPFLAHAGWNWTEALLFGASPNPGHDPAGSILNVDLVGPAWLGGSGDGMNSALPATIVLALLIVPLLIWRRRPVSGSCRRRSRAARCRSCVRE